MKANKILAINFTLYCLDKILNFVEPVPYFNSDDIREIIACKLLTISIKETATVGT